jgi:hypothetical protein
MEKKHYFAKGLLPKTKKYTTKLFYIDVPKKFSPFCSADSETISAIFQFQKTIPIPVKKTIETSFAK